MNATIAKIVNLLFEDLAESEEVLAIRDEIQQNCQERYQDLREAGISEDDAIHAVIESLNGMEAIIPAKATKPQQSPKQPKRKRQQRSITKWKKKSAHGAAIPPTPPFMEFIWSIWAVQM